MKQRWYHISRVHFVSTEEANLNWLAFVTKYGYNPELLKLILHFSISKSDKKLKRKLFNYSKTDSPTSLHFLTFQYINSNFILFFFNIYIFHIFPFFRIEFDFYQNVMQANVKLPISIWYVVALFAHQESLKDMNLF